MGSLSGALFRRGTRALGVGLVASTLVLGLSVPRVAANSQRYAEEFNGLALRIAATEQQMARLATARTKLEAKVERLDARLDAWSSYAYKASTGESLPWDITVGVKNAGARHYLGSVLQDRRELLAEFKETRADLAALELNQAVAGDMLEARQREVDRIRKILQREEERAQARPRAVMRANAAAMPDVAAPDAAAETAIAYAEAQLGKPYLFAATGPDSFDCSGLTMRAWEAAGIGLAHFSGAQYQATQRVTRDELLPGDLVFLGPGGVNHVALYVGDSLVISAPYAGQVVRVQAIYENASGYGRVAR